MSSLPLKAASIQYRAVTADKAENISCLSVLVKEAATKGARIIVLPEMCTTGFTIDNPLQAALLAEPIPGPATEVFSKLARHSKVYLVLGLAEYDCAADKFYNSQILIDPDGVIVGKYRKINLFGPDFNWAERGNLGYQAVDIEWGRLGLGICFDINFQEFTDFISRSAISVLAFSTNWVGDDLPFFYWSEMLANGGFYFIAANNWGREGEICFSGGSIILSPELSVLSQSSSPVNAILYAGIEFKKALPAV